MMTLTPPPRRALRRLLPQWELSEDSAVLPSEMAQESNPKTTLVIAMYYHLFN